MATTSSTSPVLEKRLPWTLFILSVVLLLFLAGSQFASLAGSNSSIALWIVGAAALGLLSGFVTGASEQQGAGAEFLRFLSGGILVPLLGAISSLIQLPQKTTEHFSYSADQITQKITETTIPLPGGYVQPLSIVGTFMLAYSLFAIVGIVVGIHRRKAGQEIKFRA